MRTKTINIYSADELSGELLARAHERYINSGSFEYAWIGDGLGSIKAFCAEFGAGIIDYSISTYESSYIKTDVDQNTFRGVKPSDILDILSLDNTGKNWPTGYYLDSVLFCTFQDKVKEHGNVNGAFNDAIDTAVKNIVDDMKHQETAEHFLDMAIGNNWEFDELGILQSYNPNYGE